MNRALDENPLELLIRKLKTHHDLTPEDHRALMALPMKLRKATDRTAAPSCCPAMRSATS